MKTKAGYSDWTLEELEAEKQRLQGEVEALRVEIRDLLPYLDAAWRRRNVEEAAKADPSLTQTIGQNQSAIFMQQEWQAFVEANGREPSSSNEFANFVAQRIVEGIGG